MNGYLIFILVLLTAFCCATIARVFLKQKTFLYLFTLVQTQKFIKLIDNLSKKYEKQITWLANFGIIAGFGPFGIDYLIKDKANKSKRIFVFIVSLFVFIMLSYKLAGNLFLTNPIIPTFISYFIIGLTGLMGLSGFILGSLIFSAYDIIAKMFVGKVACPGVGLVIPGVHIPKTNFFIPWYGWLILIVAAFIHEFSHGIMLRVAKVKLKSVGVILFGILPLGAFVEPNEEQLKKINRKKVTKMYAAGPASNLFLAVVFVLLLLFIASPINRYTTSIDNQRELGLVVRNVTETSEICGSSFDNPAYGKLDKNDHILSVNGRTIKTQNDLKKSVKPDYDNVFVVKNLDTNLTRTEHIRTNELGNIGINAEIKIDDNVPLPQKYKNYKLIYQIIFWFVMLNFIIATTNFLPTIPFDGGYLAQNIYSEYLPKRHDEEKRMKMVKRFFGYLAILLLILNIVPYFL
jgi:membrane-associated protease RseP (regulator of RpoE activity)